MKRLSVMAAAVMGLIWPVAGLAQEEYALQYKHMKPGESMLMKTTNNMVGTMQVPGMGTQSLAQKQQQWLKQECLAIDESGNATVRTTFERVAQDSSIGPMRINFDTANPPASQPGGDSPALAMQKAMGSAMVGHSIEAVMTSEGKCLKMTGMQEMMDSMFKEMPGGKEAAGAMKEMFSEDNFKQQFANATTWLPTKPVRIGEVWSTELRMKLGPIGEMVMKSKNKLLSVETIDGRHIARVGTTSNMEIGNGGEGMKIAGQTMKMKMTSTGGTGAWLWDLDRARMIRLQQICPMDMTMDMGSTSQPNDSFKMTQKLNYSTAMTVVGDELAEKLLPTETVKAPPVTPAKSMLEAGATQPAAK
jgi:hypothetical protein